MSPGVTHLPVASMTTASAGAATSPAPTAATLPSCSSTAAFCRMGPAAVATVALRMRVGREGSGVYVEGYGAVLAAAVAAVAVAAFSSAVPGRVAPLAQPAASTAATAASGHERRKAGRRGREQAGRQRASDWAKARPPLVDLGWIA